MLARVNFFYLVIIVFAFLILSGCSFSNLKKDLQELEAMGNINGVVVVEKVKATGPIVVGLITDDPVQPVLVSYRVLNKPGEFEFIVPMDKYKIFAFEDTNGDQKYQPSEYISQITAVGEIGQDQKVDLTITIMRETQQSLQQQALKLKSSGVKRDEYKYVTPGTLTRLDSPAFGQENISKGLWQPLQFVRNVPFGLFCLEPYDKNKIPVLFVHGVSGSPKEFDSLIAGLDSSKFQPLVYYYPSGFSISLIGEALNRAIEETQILYGFNELIVNAHSMGGLVTRSYLNIYSQSEKPFVIKKYITISTPWGGHDAASMGLKYAPTVIPVWRDIVPNSDFLKTVFATPLPEATRHFLLFGYRGDSAFAGGNSDGVVSIKSQLYMEVQKGAKLTRGYDENHTSILDSKEVITTINVIITPHKGVLN